MKDRRYKRELRHQRVRKIVSGTKNQPRLVVFRSNKHIYAQLVEDKEGKTLVAASDFKVKNTNSEYQGTNSEKKAYEIGLTLGKSAVSKKIEKAVFDRAGYKFHGKVKALAEGARKGGLKF